MLKKKAGSLGQSPCSRNARLRKALVGRAQLGSSQPPLESDSSPAALLDGLFEHSSGSFPVVMDVRAVNAVVCQNVSSVACEEVEAGG